MPPWCLGVGLTIKRNNSPLSAIVNLNAIVISDSIILQLPGFSSIGWFKHSFVVYTYIECTMMWITSGIHYYRGGRRVHPHPFHWRFPGDPPSRRYTYSPPWASARTSMMDFGSFYLLADRAILTIRTIFCFLTSRIIYHPITGIDPWMRYTFTDLCQLLPPSKNDDTQYRYN